MAPNEFYVEANGVFALDKEGGYAGVHDIVRRGQRTPRDGSCGKNAREREEARTSTLAFFAIPECTTGFNELRGHCCLQFASHLRDVNWMTQILLVSTHLHDDFNHSIAFRQCNGATDHRAAAIGGD